ncbi:TPR repeat [Vibrio astriarenae]|nr:TPR repeat [Vibrio sp. C7]
MSDVELPTRSQTTIKIILRESKLSWLVYFNGTEFIPTNRSEEMTFHIGLDDIIGFPTIREIKDRIDTGVIKIEGNNTSIETINYIIDSIDQLRINECSRYLRRMLRIRDTRIEDKALSTISIRDATTPKDVDYIRDQALASERTDPALAYYLMNLAHTLRPKGPFIKKKLNNYQSKGFDLLYQRDAQNNLRGIEISKEKVVYFPVPKSACSSIKLALYEAKNGIPFQNTKFHHIHEYWSTRQHLLSNYQRKVIIIRDPVKRFLSAYANRVLDHGELNQAAIEQVAPWLVKVIPNFKPTLQQFLNDIDTYMLVPSIEHHFKPLSWHIKHDLGFFTDVIKMEDIDSFKALILRNTKEKLSYQEAK